MNVNEYTLSIAKRIKYEREQRGWSQQKLADLCGKSRSWVCKFETGVNGLPIDELKILCEVLHIDIISLFNSENMSFDSDNTSLACEMPFKIDLSKEDINFINEYHKLSEKGKEKLTERLNELLLLEGL